jgi:chromosome segregation ATPase
MFKKAALIGTGALLVGGLLFGGRLIPYAKTAYNKISESAEMSIPLSFKIDAVRDQLKKIKPEINNMVYQIAKERAEIKRLEREVNQQSEALAKQQSDILNLRTHLTSGEEVYVATNGKTYSNTRVEEDLRHRFSIFQTAKQTADKTSQILELRQKALETALSKLDQAQTLERELEVQIENLMARERMVDVAKTASNIRWNDSELSRTQEMIDEINCRIDAEEEMLALAPQYLGEIPVNTSERGSGNIVYDIDTYFGLDDNTASTSTAKDHVVVNK